MRVAAYCRVSTDKSDQLNSLETQKKFFEEYTQKNGHSLVELYADEGISGTKIKNRKDFLRLMEDARCGRFDMVVVKDISRFARNTVDLLQSIRTLKALGIETTFLTANMSVLGQSEFVLTIFGALAQEESANTSKRVKFGKKMNAGKGRVPNLVYGYDKTAGEYFDMEINQAEKEVIQQIYDWYTKERFGAAKIANMLNGKGLKTKRGCQWSQNAVCRILTNELYTGKIINGKEEVADFLTGVREKKDKSEWMVTNRPDLRLIEPEQFLEAQELLLMRRKNFCIKGERQSNKYLFSTLVKCKECGWSFRRTVRTYKNTYIRWVCSGHNGKGVDNCPNTVTLDEEMLMEALEKYFMKMFGSGEKVSSCIVKEMVKEYRAKDEKKFQKKELENSLAKLKKIRQRYIEMYTDDLISRAELNEKIGNIKAEMEQLESELKLFGYHLDKNHILEEVIQMIFRTKEDIVSICNMTNEQLKQLIQKIEVDQAGNVDVYLHDFS